MATFNEEIKKLRDLSKEIIIRLVRKLLIFDITILIIFMVR